LNNPSPQPVYEYQLKYATLFSAAPKLDGDVGDAATV
jgi:hypothetical protein